MEREDVKAGYGFQAFDRNANVRNFAQLLDRKVVANRAGTIPNEAVS